MRNPHSFMLAIFGTFLACWAVAADASAKSEATPTAVVRSCIERANKFDYEGAGKFFDAVALSGLEVTGTFQRLMDVWTRKGTVSEFVVLRETIKQDRAVVSATIKFEEGGVQFDDRTLLIFRRGAWKIVSSQSVALPSNEPKGTIE